MRKPFLHFAAGLAALAAPALAGPYSASKGDSANPYDAPVPGFVGPAGDGKSPRAGVANFVNPLFFGWASAVDSYIRADSVAVFDDPAFALGPVTGDLFDVVSLGESETPGSTPPGSLTLEFSTPIRNLTGADLAVFENGFTSGGESGTAGQILGELIYVEVSTDGQTFARFPSISLTASPVGSYGTLDATAVFNLAGKHLNGEDESWGTPFDLTYVAAEPEVTSGAVNLNDIRYVRLVDVPGSGAFFDRATDFFNPLTGQPYPANHAIYDPFPTFLFSAGADIEAVGVVSRTMTFAAWLDQRALTGNDRDAAADPDGNGVGNLLDYASASFGKNGAPVSAALTGGRVAIRFVRDERAADVIYEVQASPDLAQWTTIARSEDGLPVAGVDGFSPPIAEESASAVASVGVLRAVRVSDTATVSGANRRFLRVKIRLKTP